MAKYKRHFSIMSYDVDANNNLKPTIISKLLNETANLHMKDRRPTYYELFFEGLSFIAVRMVFEIKEQLHPYDEVDVLTWTAEGKGATFFRCYSIERDGVEVIRAYSEWTIVNLNTGKLCHRDEIDLSNYEVDEVHKLDTPVKFHFPSDLEFEKCGEHIVEYTDTDMNGHMNNTVYQNMIWDFVPDVEHKKLIAFSLRYMAEAPQGSTIEIYRAEAPKTVSEWSDSEEAYYFKTVVGGKANTAALIRCAKTERYTEVDGPDMA